MTATEILADIKKNFFGNNWKVRAGKDVPEVEQVGLGNDAVTLDGTVLYADLNDSTGLVNNFKPWFAAEMYKAYLNGASKIIKRNGGQITAFDGDRVMAVFHGLTKNTSAARTALQINHIVIGINAAIKATYPNTAFVLKQSVGIDTSPLFVTKTGIRDYNDLVWVGRSANYAAKLCALGDGNYVTHITENVYSVLDKSLKTSGTPERSVWEKVMWNERGISIYRSNWQWPF